MSPNTLTGGDGEVFAVIDKAHSENRQVTFELTYTDGTKEALVLEPEMFMLDSPGEMYYTEPEQGPFSEEGASPEPEDAPEQPSKQPPSETETAESEPEPAAEPTEPMTMEYERKETEMQITISAIPAAKEQFPAISPEDLKQPENTCAIFLLALDLYTRDKDAGLEIINALRGPRPMSGAACRRLSRRRYKPSQKISPPDGGSAQEKIVLENAYGLA